MLKLDNKQLYYNSDSNVTNNSYSHSVAKSIGNFYSPVAAIMAYGVSIVNIGNWMGQWFNLEI